MRADPTRNSGDHLSNSSRAMGIELPMSRPFPPVRARPHDSKIQMMWKEVSHVKLLNPELQKLEQRIAPDLGIGIGVGVDVSLDGSSDTSTDGSDGSSSSSS
jgi:hypothetical protein